MPLLRQHSGVNRTEANSPRWPLVAARLPDTPPEVAFANRAGSSRWRPANCLRYSCRPGMAAPGQNTGTCVDYGWRFARQANAAAAATMTSLAINHVDAALLLSPNR